jgi:hypothetical protein
LLNNQGCLNREGILSLEKESLALPAVFEIEKTSDRG